MLGSSLPRKSALKKKKEHCEVREEMRNGKVYRKINSSQLVNLASTFSAME